MTTGEIEVDAVVDALAEQLEAFPAAPVTVVRGVGSNFRGHLVAPDVKGSPRSEAANLGSSAPVFWDASGMGAKLAQIVAPRPPVPSIRSSGSEGTRPLNGTSPS